MSNKKKSDSEDIPIEYSDLSQHSDGSVSVNNDTPPIEYEVVPPRVEEDLNDKKYSSNEIRNKNKKHRCRPDWKKEDVKNWTLVACCLLALYGVLALFFYAFMAAMLDDTKVTLICYLAFWLTNMAVIVGMVIYGSETDQLTKYERKVEMSRGDVEPDLG